MSLIKCCFDPESGIMDSMAQKCTDPGCCCGCCSALRPRYKRLVDNIFPVNPQDGLVKSNMEKLTFYALSSPEKLDRIGDYLYQKAGRDIYRRRYGFVVIAMESMDQLLLACHAQTLNLFVESFLKMVQKLLESSEPQLQIMATQSFVRFANIEEDTPSYHRRYDFFVSKFSSMCHSNDTSPSTRDALRLAGIKGLQGVVRKTVTDDLVENIWDSVHMDKIVPSLLFNMQNSNDSSSKACELPATMFFKPVTPVIEKKLIEISEVIPYKNRIYSSTLSLECRTLIYLPGDKYFVGENDSNRSCDQSETDSPPILGESCLRELVGRASFGHIRSVLRPVLRHLDLHDLWVPNHFATHTFKVMMYSVQAQYSYAVVESLMTHLDDNSNASPKIRTSIADVLSKIIAIAAGESVGPSVLEIINSLLLHLDTSVSSPTKQKRHETEEKLYQEALINALGEFANHLPDYQKIEIMMFIMSKVPYPNLTQVDDKEYDKNSSDALLVNILLKSLLKVGTKYQTIHFNTTFPVSFLEPLLRMSLAPDRDMRLLVQKILHTLVDRHNNLEKLLKPTVNVTDLELTLEKCSRPDIIFIRKHGPEMFQSLYESLEMANNTVDNIEAVYTTLALLTVELTSEETIMDIIRLLISIQDMALTSSSLTSDQKINLHAVVVSLFVLLPNVVQISCLIEYAESIVGARRNGYSHMLPVLHNKYEVQIKSPAGDLLLDLNRITDCLKTAGMDVGRLLQAPPYIGGLQHRHSWVDSGLTTSAADLPAEVESIHSSPGLFKKYPEEELTFDSMKKVLNENPEVKKEFEESKRIKLADAFRNESFQELVLRTQPRNDLLQNKLNDIFSKLSSGKENIVTSPSTIHHGNNKQPAYEILFPELFAY